MRSFCVLIGVIEGGVIGAALTWGFLKNDFNTSADPIIGATIFFLFITVVYAMIADTEGK